MLAGVVQRGGLMRGLAARFFASLNELRTGLAAAQKRSHDLAKLDKELENIVNWLESAPADEECGGSDGLIQKVKSQKLLFARLRQDNETTIRDLQQQIRAFP
jgi:t-SNARE complex subunit (syntaxin)